MADSAKKVEKLATSKDPFERIEAIKNDYNLRMFVDDNDWRVRNELARKGYALDTLVNDENYIIRKEVAGHGCFLNKLSKDEDVDVRREVARQGGCLPALILDDMWVVRAEVAKQGYGLDKLINDSNKYVVQAVSSFLKENELTLEKWEKKFPDKCFFDCDTGEQTMQIPKYDEYMKEKEENLDAETVQFIISEYKASKKDSGDTYIVDDDDEYEENEGLNNKLNVILYSLIAV